MPLERLFTEKLNALKMFMRAPKRRVLVLQHAPDLRQLLLRLLVGLDNDDRNPHVMVYADVSFQRHDQYFVDLLGDISSQNEKFRSQLADVAVELPAVPKQRPNVHPAMAFTTYMSSVADCLPDSLGAVVLLMDPKAVADDAGFAWAMEVLATHTTSDWARYVVLEPRASQRLNPLAKLAEQVTFLDFHFAPEAIEAQVKTDLQSGHLKPDEHRRYAMMAASFAASNRRFEEAESLNLRTLGMAREAGAPVEEANILYNLGNNRLEQGRLAEATDAFVQAGNLCLAHKINPLLAMVFTNLGVALHRQQRGDEALQSFKVAHQTYKGLGHRPGEAYVLDCIGRLFALENRAADAERVWLQTLNVYEGITAPHLQDVRKAGRDDVLSKLERLYEETKQSGKLTRLRAQRE